MDVHALRRRPRRARRRRPRGGDARLARPVGRPGNPRAHAPALPEPGEARRGDLHRRAAPPPRRPGRATAGRGRDHAAQELERARLVREGGPAARARPPRLREPARLQHLPEPVPVPDRARRRRRLRLRPGARPQPRHGRLLRRRSAAPRRRLRAAGRLRARPRHGRGGGGDGLQGPAGTVRLPCRALAQPHRPVPGVGGRRGGGPADRLPRGRRRPAPVAALLRQRPAAGAGLPRRRRELPLRRLHGDPVPAHADARHHDLRRHLRPLPAPQGGRHRAGRHLAAELDAPARGCVRGVRQGRGAPAEARAPAERLRAPADPRHALPHRARRLDHRAVRTGGLPVLVGLAARRGRPQSHPPLREQPRRRVGRPCGSASTATTSST